MEWWEKEGDEVPDPPSPGPIQPMQNIDQVFDFSALGNPAAPGPIQPMDGTPVGEFTPVAAAPPATGLGVSTLGVTGPAPIDTGPAPLGSTGSFVGTVSGAPAPDLPGPTAPYDDGRDFTQPDVNAMGFNAPPNVFDLDALSISEPQPGDAPIAGGMPYAFQAVQDRAEERFERDAIDGPFEEVNFPLDDIYRNLPGAYSGEKERLQFAYDNELPAYNLWITGQDAPTREDAGVDGPGLIGSTAGEVAETAGQIRRNIQRVPVVGDALKFLGDVLLTGGELVGATTSDLPFKTRVPVGDGQTLPSVGRVVTEMTRSPSAFLGYVTNEQGGGINLPAFGAGGAISNMGSNAYFSALDFARAQDAATSAAVGFDIADRDDQTPEQRDIVGYGELNAFTPGAVAETITAIATQGERIEADQAKALELVELAVEARGQGDISKANELMYAAAVLGHEAYRESLKNPIDYVDQNSSFWNEVIRGSLLDISPVFSAGAKLVGLDPVSRRIGRAGKFVEDVDYEQYIDRIARATTQDEELINAVGQHNFLKDVASLGFNVKDTSLASRNMYAVHRGITAVGGAIDTTRDMRKVLTTWLDNPEQLLEGFDDLDSPGMLLRSTEDGKAYFGLEALANDEMLEARKGLLAVRDEVEELTTLLGDGQLNHRLFYDELRELAYKGELKRRGSLTADIPIGAVAVEAGVDEDGSAVLRYLDGTGQNANTLRVRTTGDSLAAAERAAVAENKVLNSYRQAQSNMSIVATVANVQRGIMSGMVLNLSPRALVRHVISNTAQLKADGIHVYEKLESQLEWVAKKYEGANDGITSRQIDALTDDINNAVRASYEGGISLTPWSRKLKEWRSGLTKLGAVDIGEEAFAMTASVQGARRFIQQQAPKMANEMADILRGMGKNEAFVRNAQARMLESMVHGGGRDVARTFRNIVNGATVEFSLSEYGPYLDALGGTGVDELANVMRAAYGRDPNEVARQVREVFDRNLRAEHANAATTGIEPGMNTFNGMEDVRDVADLTRDLRHVFRRIGLPENQAKQKIDELGQRFKDVHEQGRRNLIDGLMDVDDPRVAPYLIDVWAEINEARAIMRESQSASAMRAISVENSRAPRDDVRAAWEQYAVEYEEIHNRYLAQTETIYDNAGQAIANGELPRRDSAWRLVEEAGLSDDNVLRRSLEVEVGQAAADQPLYEMVIEAGRAYVDGGIARAYYMGRHVLERTPELNEAVFNVIVSAGKDEDMIAHITRGRVLDAQDRLLPQASDDFYTERNMHHREGIRASRERWDAAAKEIALMEERYRAAPGRNPLEFPDVDIDAELESRLDAMIGEVQAEALARLQRDAEIDEFVGGRFTDAAPAGPAPQFGEFEGGPFERMDQGQQLPLQSAPTEGQLMTAAEYYRGEIDGYAEVLRQMRADWENLGKASANRSIGLQATLNQYRNNTLWEGGQTSDDVLREFGEALTGGDDGRAIEGWLQQYDGLQSQMANAQASYDDARRFTDGNRKLTVDEILAGDEGLAADVERMTASAFNERTGISRRELLDYVASLEGNVPNFGDELPFDTYFHMGIPVGPLMNVIFNMDDGESLLSRVWKNGRKRSALSDGQSRLDMGMITRARLENAGQAERSLRGDIDRWVYGRGADYAEQFTPAERNALLQYQAEKLSPGFDNMLAGASKAGELVSSFGMVDFANGARHIDDWIGLLVPYHFWYTRAFKNYAERAMTQPGYISRMSNYYGALDAEGENQNLPNRNRGKIPLPFYQTADGDQVFINDPITALMPPAFTNFQFNEYANPEEGKTSIERIMRTMDLVGLGSYPWVRAGVETASGNGDDVFPGEVVPIYQDLGWLAKGATGMTLPGSLPDYHNYFPARRARNDAVAGNISEYDAKMVMDIARRKMTGEPLLPEQVNAGYEGLFDKYNREAGWEKFVPRLLSHMVGFTGSVQPQEEIDVRNAQGLYNNLGFDPVTNPTGSQAAAQFALREGDPSGELPLDLLDTQFSLNGVTRDTDRMRPGESAATGRGFERGAEIRDALYGASSAARDALILADLNQNPDSGDLMEAGNQAVIDGAKEYLTPVELHGYLAINPDSSSKDLIDYVVETINGRENPSAGEFPASTRDKRNPQERAEDAFFSMMEGATDGESPTYPGEDATPDEKQNYYAARAAHLQSQLDYIEEFGGRAVAMDDGPTPSRADFALADMLEGEYAADLLRDYRNRLNSEIQENYYNRRELESAFNSQLNEQRESAVSSRLGADVLAHWQAYRALPKDSDERRAYGAANPVVYQANMVAYSPQDYEQALSQFGKDIFARADSYPRGDGSGADLKAWNAQYSDEIKEQVYALYDWRGAWSDNFEAQAAQLYGGDIIQLADSYPSTGKGYSKAQRNAWISSNQEGYARLKDFWTYRSAQFDQRDAQLSSQFSSDVVAAADARPSGQGDPRKAAWRESNGQDAYNRLQAYWDWSEGRRDLQQEELSAPLLGTPEADDLLRYGRDPIDATYDPVQAAQVGALPAGTPAGNAPGETLSGESAGASSTVQPAQAGGNLAAGSVSSEGYSDINQRMQPFWDAYKALPNSAAKAAYLIDNPDFADFYQSSLGLKDNERWWLSTRSERGASVQSGGRSGGRSYSSNSGGQVVVQSSPYFESLSSLARDVPRLGRTTTWVETPWPIFRR